MPDSDSGYYSPNETIQYLPPRERGAGGGIVQAMCMAAVQDMKSCCTELKRYWATALDRDFLMSSASRRDLWRWVLPLPGLLALLADGGHRDLIFLDVGLAVSLFILAALPTGWIISDLVFCLVYAAYLPVHSVMSFAPGILSATSPVLVTFTMAACGINVGMLSCFVTVSAFAAPYVAYSWTSDQIVACAYVSFLAMVIERRATLLLTSGDRYTTEFGYKALGLTSMDDVAHGHSRAEILHSRYTAEPLSRAGTGSDTEDAGRPLPKETSGLALVDQLMTKLGRGADGKAGPLNSIFARLGGAAAPPVSSRSAASRQRFAAEQVNPPGAADHEAPQFDKAMDVGPDLEGARPDSELGVPLHPRSLSPTSSYQSLPLPGSPAKPGMQNFLRGLKLGGFNNDALNVLFVEKPAVALKVNGRETYWPASGNYFVYKSANTNTWGIGKAKRFKEIKEGKSHGLAHSPEGYEIWLDVNEVPSTPATSKKSWREWDIELNKWVSRPGAGVQSRGKVRPKTGAINKIEVAVQTYYEVFERAVQTGEEEPSPPIRLPPPLASAASMASMGTAAPLPTDTTKSQLDPTTPYAAASPLPVPSPSFQMDSPAMKPGKGPPTQSIPRLPDLSGSARSSTDAARP